MSNSQVFPDLGNSKGQLPSTKPCFATPLQPFMLDEMLMVHENIIPRRELISAKGLGWDIQDLDMVGPGPLARCCCGCLISLSGGFGSLAPPLFTSSVHAGPRPEHFRVQIGVVTWASLVQGQESSWLLVQDLGLGHTHRWGRCHVPFVLISSSSSYTVLWPPAGVGGTACELPDMAAARVTPMQYYPHSALSKYCLLKIKV